MKAATGLWLVLLGIWLLLWDRLSVANVLGGIVVATVVLVAVARPSDDRINLSFRVRPTLAFLAWTTVEVFRSNLRMAVDILLRPRQVDTHVVAIEIPGCSDGVLTIIAGAISLAPGALAIEITHDPDTVYIHLLHRGDVKPGERAARHLASLAVGAFGPDGALEEFEAHDPMVPETREGEVGL